MVMPELTDEMIRLHAPGDSFRKGQEYYRDGAVLSLVQRDNTLEAQVEGSEIKPYRVRCTVDGAGVRDATCTCAYAYGGWCKHIVASLLAVARGDAIEERPSIDALLLGLDRDALQQLVLRLARRDPDLAEIIEDEIHMGVGPPRESSPMRPPNLQAVRRQMVRALHHPPDYTERGWHTFHLGSEASGLLEQVWALIRSGDGRTAMDILDAMTDEAMENWQSIMEDEEGETLDFVQNELGPAWVEAILTSKLTPSEREVWEPKLDAWESELADYADAESFVVALKALREGWDDPELQLVLRGETGQRPIVEVEDSYDLGIRDRLTIARLNVLERQGRDDEYLNLARAEGQVLRYTTMLARQGHVAAAVEYGVAHLQRADDVLALAHTMREGGHMDEAERVAERGLDLEGRKAPLGAWLADLAAGLGHRDLALRAATIAFQEDGSLTSYLGVQSLAEDAWPGLRAELLTRLRGTQDFYIQGPVDVFLHEGLIEDAIALLDRSSYPFPELIRQVARAAVEANPDWVIRASRRQAEEIMNAGRSGHYGEAADWLGLAKTAFLASGQAQQWQEYLDALLEQHRRKYKLMPFLRELG
jgi:uncharacterized Zn finger protein